MTPSPRAQARRPPGRPAIRLLVSWRPTGLADGLALHALPGGNAISFDWTLLQGHDWPKPWMLSGGLTPENLADAVRISGARRVDLASGVEDRPGVKSPAKIKALLALAKML